MSVATDRKELFADVVFLVDANGFKQHGLWLTEHYRPVHLRSVKDWEQEPIGHGVEIGTCDGRPVVLSLTYAKLEGRRVCFWYGCSQVVDHAMIDAWLEARTGDIKWDDGRRPARCDAMNFHDCLNAIRALNARSA